MNKSTKSGLGALAAGMSLIISGGAIAQTERQQQQPQQQQPQQQQPQQQQPQQQSSPEQRPQQREDWGQTGTLQGYDPEKKHQQQPTEHSEPTLDSPDVETGGVEEGMVPDGQHADHLHWSAGSLPPNRFHADDLVGSEVRSADDQPVGEVSTLVFDEDGRILAAVVETGTLGLGGKAVAIPWEYVRPVRTGDRDFYLRVQIDPDSLEDAPEYERD